MPSVRRTTWRRDSTRGARGQAQLEFILSIVTILFLIFCIWELVMAVYTMNVLSDAAKEGVRCGILHGTWDAGNQVCVPENPGASPPPANCPDVAGLVTNYARASLHDISAITVNVTYPDTTCKALNRVRVEVQYRYVPYLNLPLTPTLHTAAEGRFIF
jgi:hypothetical protein